MLPPLLTGPLAEDLESSVEVVEGSPPLSLPAPSDEFLRSQFSLPELDDGGRPLLNADGILKSGGAEDDASAGT